GAHPPCPLHGRARTRRACVMIYQSEHGNLSIALGGDVMLTRRLSVFTEPSFLALTEIFRSADVGFGNLEGPVRHEEGRPGITPVGSKVDYRVPAKEFAALREIGKGLGFEIDRQRSREHFFSAKEVPPEAERETSFLGSQFISAECYGISSHADAEDVEDN